MSETRAIKCFHSIVDRLLLFVFVVLFIAVIGVSSSKHVFSLFRGNGLTQYEYKFLDSRLWKAFLPIVLMHLMYVDSNSCEQSTKKKMISREDTSMIGKAGFEDDNVRNVITIRSLARNEILPSS